ncbi:MAG: RNA polymerase subunit sigma-24 [Verrucomicrobiaceae bacterium]|nr:MAG: RNA polymerase subunit sigma-24 [Verrucomicrobiaceae bacterium]
MKNPPSTLDSLVQGETTDALLPKIYRELRNLAAMHLRNESGYQTLQPTALVHEAWVRISGDEDDTWKNNQHFLGVAAIVMRRILVERARSKATIKRKVPQHSFMENPGVVADADHVIMIHECLTILEKTDPDSAKVVLLKFYGGFSNPEIAQSTGWSIRTVERQWMLAKARLYRLICRSLGEEPGEHIR